MPPPAVTPPTGEPFPSALAERLEDALTRRDGCEVKRLFVEDPTAHYGKAWYRHNRGELHADFLPQAWNEPLDTLERMTTCGRLRSIAELWVMMERVLSRTALKYGARSSRRLNPKDRHGRPRMLSGSDLASDPLGRTATPDELAVAAEIPTRVREVAAGLDLLSVRIYWTTQLHRIYVGKSGAYRFVAQMLHFDAIGNPVQFRGADDVDFSVDVPKAQVDAVRRFYLAVRRVLTEQLTIAGFDVPEDRKLRRRR